jgi:hypothetical protein
MKCSSLLALALSLTVQAADKPAPAADDAAPAKQTPQRIVKLIKTEDLSPPAPANKKTAQVWPDDKAAAARNTLEESLLGKQIQLSLRALPVRPVEGKAYIPTKSVNIADRGAFLSFLAIFYFDENTPALAQIKADQTVAISGTVKSIKAETVKKGELSLAVLSLVLEHSKIEK